MKNETKDHPQVIAFPPLIWLMFAAASVLGHFVFPWRMMDPQISIPIGGALMMLALSLALWAAYSLKAAGTNVNPSQPVLKIVQKGPYRFTRNPMYLALCLFLIALAFFLNDWLGLILVVPLAAVLHFGVILREETYLEGKFGENYLILKRNVRRWI